MTSYNDADRFHTYTNAPAFSLYTVQISDICIGWDFSPSNPQSGSRLSIVGVTNWCRFLPVATATGGVFMGAANLVYLPSVGVPVMQYTYSPAPPTYVTSLARMFKDCSSLEYAPNIGSWNVAGVTDFTSMFENAIRYNSPIGSWSLNPSADVTMTTLLNGATSFNQPLSWPSMGRITELDIGSSGISCLNYEVTLSSWAATVNSTLLPLSPRFTATSLTYTSYVANSRIKLFLDATTSPRRRPDLSYIFEDEITPSKYRNYGSLGNGVSYDAYNNDTSNVMLVSNTSKVGSKSLFFSATAQSGIANFPRVGVTPATPFMINGASTPITIGAWFMITSTSAAGRGIVSIFTDNLTEAGGFNRHSYEITMNAASTQLFAGVFGTGTTVVSPSGGISFNVWHHVVAVYQSSSSQTTYYDGGTLAGGAQGFVNNPGTTWYFRHFGIGCGIAGAGPMRNGYIDGAFYYLSALSADDVYDLYRGVNWGARSPSFASDVIGDAPTPTCPPPVAAASTYSCAAKTPDYTGRCGIGYTGSSFSQCNCSCVTPGGSLDSACNTTNRVAVNTIAASTTSTCFIRYDSLVYCTGLGTSGQIGNAASATVNTPTAVAGVLSGVGVYSLTGGLLHYCAIIASSRFGACWGQGTNGKIGDNSATTRNAPVNILGPLTSTALLMISAGTEHTCAIASGTGFGYCWGLNGNGQLGDGTVTQRSIPTAIQGVLASVPLSWISCGAFYTCAIRASDSRTFCWGINGAGQLGDGTVTQSTVPVAVIAPLNVSASMVECTLETTCATLASTGILYCWGRGNNGQRGDGTTTSIQSTPTIVVGALAALRVAYISHGEPSSHRCVITFASNTLYCWGLDTGGQLGNVFGAPSTTTTPQQIVVNAADTTSSLKFAAVDCGDLHTCAVTTSYETYCWGTATTGQFGDGYPINPVSGITTPQLVPGFETGVTEVTAGGGDSVCARKGGVSYCWGANDRSQLGFGTDTEYYKATPTATSIQFKFVTTNTPGGGIGNTRHACGIRVDNDQLMCWGANNFGQLGDGTTTQRNAPVYVLGELNGAAVSGATCGGGATDSNAGWTCAIRANDSVLFCFGAGTLGQMGDGSTTSRSLPNRVLGIFATTGAYQVANSDGWWHACALENVNRTTYCWGRVPEGQAGDGTVTSPKLLPVAALGDLRNASMKQISMGNVYSMGIRAADNYVFTWGANNAVNLGDGTGTNRQFPTRVAGTFSLFGADYCAGGGYSSGGNPMGCCTREVDRQLQCWGVNSRGGIGDGTTSNRNAPVQVLGALSNAAVSQFAVGNLFVCAIRANDTSLWCWGNVEFGALGNGYASIQALPKLMTRIQVSTGLHLCAFNNASRLSPGCGYNVATTAPTPFPTPNPTPLPTPFPTPTPMPTQGFGMTQCFAMNNVAGQYYAPEWGAMMQGTAGTVPLASGGITSALQSPVGSYGSGIVLSANSGFGGVLYRPIKFSGIGSFNWAFSYAQTGSDMCSFVMVQASNYTDTTNAQPIGNTGLFYNTGQMYLMHSQQTVVGVAAPVGIYARTRNAVVLANDTGTTPLTGAATKYVWMEYNNGSLETYIYYSPNSTKPTYPYFTLVRNLETARDVTRTVFFGFGNSAAGAGVHTCTLLTNRFECATPGCCVTDMPTPSPTTQPTLLPTQFPTVQPTPQPTPHPTFFDTTYCVNETNPWDPDDWGSMVRHFSNEILIANYSGGTSLSSYTVSFGAALSMVATPGNGGFSAMNNYARFNGNSSFSWFFRWTISNTGGLVATAALYQVPFSTIDKNCAPASGGGSGSGFPNTNATYLQFRGTLSTIFVDGINGTLLFSVANPFVMSTGSGIVTTTESIWFDYDATTDRLMMFVSNTTLKPITPTMNITSALNANRLASTPVYFAAGFSAGQVATSTFTDYSFTCTGVGCCSMQLDAQPPATPYPTAIPRDNDCQLWFFDQGFDNWTTASSNACSVSPATTNAMVYSSALPGIVDGPGAVDGTAYSANSDQRMTSPAFAVLVGETDLFSLRWRLTSQANFDYFCVSQRDEITGEFYNISVYAQPTYTFTQTLLNSRPNCENATEWCTSGGAAVIANSVFQLVPSSLSTVRLTFRSDATTQTTGFAIFYASACNANLRKRASDYFIAPPTPAPRNSTSLSVFQHVMRTFRKIV